MKKRILAIALALIMLVTLSNTVFAKESSGSIGFTGGEEIPSPVDGGPLYLYTEELDSVDGEITELEEHLDYLIGRMVNYDGNDLPLEDPANFYTHRKTELADDMETIRASYNTGANVEFGDFDLTDVTGAGTYLSSENPDGASYADVLVIDVESSHADRYAESAGGTWTVGLSRTEFTSNGAVLGATLDFNSLFNAGAVGDSSNDTNHNFAHNVPSDVSGFGGSIPVMEDGMEGVSPEVVLQGSFGYVAARFDAALTVADRSAVVDGDYMSLLTWDFIDAPSTQSLDLNA